MSDQVYVLPSELTIYEVEETYRELRSLVNESDNVVLDGANVVEIDSAGFQLLVWFLRCSHQPISRNAIRQPSEEVIKLFELVGDSGHRERNKNV
ncbi:STAS domain-containing protein [Vibrio europaeus]|jgi:ABC-type transporter Mla MlaB component|uniref:STAS domain-containing protein n=1 Tax=Vibrio europaeus TaxID=300876 RepID=UPI00148CDA31|nr:STAS domain-containing protein [Vibrio europaeus]NOH24024.1 STAS domain-containing protein [Vibrio europaeus]